MTSIHFDRQKRYGTFVVNLTCVWMCCCCYCCWLLSNRVRSCRCVRVCISNERENVQFWFMCTCVCECMMNIDCQYLPHTQRSSSATCFLSLFVMHMLDFHLGNECAMTKHMIYKFVYGWDFLRSKIQITTSMLSLLFNAFHLSAIGCSALNFTHMVAINRLTMREEKNWHW